MHTIMKTLLPHFVKLLKSMGNICHSVLQLRLRLIYKKTYLKNMANPPQSIDELQIISRS